MVNGMCLTHDNLTLYVLLTDLLHIRDRNVEDLSGGELHHRCHSQAQVGCCHHDSQGGKCGSNEPVQVRQTDDLRGFVGGILPATLREAGYLRLSNHHQVTEPTLFQRYIRVWANTTHYASGDSYRSWVFGPLYRGNQTRWELGTSIHTPSSEIP